MRVDIRLITGTHRIHDGRHRFQANVLAEPGTVPATVGSGALP